MTLTKTADELDSKQGLMDKSVLGKYLFFFTRSRILTTLLKNKMRGILCYFCSSGTDELVNLKKKKGLKLSMAAKLMS